MKSAFAASLRLGVILALTGVMVACTKSDISTDANRFRDTYGIFSTRPQTATETVVLLKLVSPALLTTAENGKTNADAAKALTEEQDLLISKMKALSPEIQVLYRYRLVINGIAVVSPISVLPQLRNLANVVYVETSESFGRPVLKLDEEAPKKLKNLLERNSVKFIGATEAHARGIRGQGLKVGIIDTGIDFTHAMFGGGGTEEIYKSIDPSKETALYPTAKVVGGIDLVGTAYDSESADYKRRTPIPDVNPLDEGGHGSHVAGTVAGKGDGENTYDGVAPDALLHAIKVFGADGSTGDAVVVAALEYAADPNSDMDLTDKLDVVNLSLGSPHGNPHILYNEASQNLSRAGVVVVASGGNSGDSDYIVGAPGVADDAISVAASVDDMDHNWKFRAVRFTTPSEPSLITEAIEGTIGKPIEEAGEVTGPLVHLGLADQELTEEQKAAVAGKIAFIDRGVVTFAAKVERAFKAGAIGVVVANNQPGEPIAMGGDGKFGIPAIMVNKDLGDKLKAEMTKGTVSIAFFTDERIEKPELIDTITGFSSKGPRSFDALIKPEISAPGAQVVSAEMGKGTVGVQMSGTSMAAPHMAGVIALLKQVHPTLTSLELKSLVMSTAKTLIAPDKSMYPISRQGAGRVQVIKAIDASLVSVPTGLSLGEITIEKKKLIRKSVSIRNFGTAARTLTLSLEADAGLSLAKAPSEVVLAPNEVKTIELEVMVDISGLPNTSSELDGILKLSEGSVEAMRIPMLAVATKVSQVKVESLVIHSTSKTDSDGAAVDLTLKNSGTNAGDAYPFNLIARDERKRDPNADPNMDHSCDLQEAGYRVIVKEGQPVLQIAGKLFEPMTTWDNCEIIALIDGDGDGIADQELAGIREDNLKGLSAKTFSSVLLDAAMTRELRKKFELESQAKKEEPKEGETKKEIVENYTAAIIALSPMLAMNHSTIAIIEAPIANLKLRNLGEVSVRIAASSKELSAIQPDDALGKDAGKWLSLNVRANGAGFADLPEKITLAPGESSSVKISKGLGSEKLLLLYPSNKPALDGLSKDQQSEIAKPTHMSEMITVSKK